MEMNSPNYCMSKGKWLITEEIQEEHYLFKQCAKEVSLHNKLICFCKKRCGKVQESPSRELQGKKTKTKQNIFDNNIIFLQFFLL